MHLLIFLNVIWIHCLLFCQVCKLLIILECVGGDIPEVDVLNFVPIAFSTVSDAFKSHNVFLLRQVVDFLKDLQENPRSRGILLTYDR